MTKDSIQVFTQRTVEVQDEFSLEAACNGIQCYQLLLKHLDACLDFLYTQIQLVILLSKLASVSHVRLSTLRCSVSFFLKISQPFLTYAGNLIFVIVNSDEFDAVRKDTKLIDNRRVTSNDARKFISINLYLSFNLFCLSLHHQ